MYAQYWELYLVACKRIEKLMIEIFFSLNNSISACQENMVVVELKAYIWNYRHVQEAFISMKKVKLNISMKFAQIMDVEIYFLTVYSQNKLHLKIKYDISLSVCYLI